MQPALLPTLDHPAPSEVNPVNPVSTDDTTAAPSAPAKARTMLSITQRAKLLAWIENNSERAATDPDSALAMSAAAALAFPIHASHVRSIRTALGIAKIKPEPPPALPPDLDLVSLYKQVAALQDDQTAHAIEAAGMKATIAALHDRLSQVIDYINTTAGMSPYTIAPLDILRPA